MTSSKEIKVYNITSKGNLGSISGILKDDELINVYHSGFGVPLDRINRECDAFRKAVLANDKTKFCTDKDLLKSPKGHIYLNPEYFSSLKKDDGAEALEAMRVRQAERESKKSQQKETVKEVQVAKDKRIKR